MELPKEVDDYIKRSIDHTLGLPVSNRTLLLKVQSLEAANHRLRDQYLNLQLQFKEKDQSLELARAEAGLNAQALKRFVDENQKLANECANLVSQCSRWERECSLYGHDREALMEFANEADEKAKDAEGRVRELEEELNRASEEAQFYKLQMEKLSVDSSVEFTSLEQKLLDGLIASLVNKDEAAKTAHSFLVANNGVESCNQLLRKWNDLRPQTQNILSLVARVQMLRNDKEHLRINLHRAEEEVKILFEENNILEEQNKRLLGQVQRNSGRKQSDSGGKNSNSTAAKSNKRKSHRAISSPVEKIDFNNVESPRHPLSSMEENSPPIQTPECNKK